MAHAPALDGIRADSVHGAPVVVVVPHLHKRAARGLVAENREARGRRGAEQRARLACGVGGHAHACEERVHVGVQLLQDGRDVEPVDEQRCAARAVCVREEVEQLQTAGVSLGCRPC